MLMAATDAAAMHGRRTNATEELGAFRTVEIASAFGQNEMVTRERMAVASGGSDTSSSSTSATTVSRHNNSYSIDGLQEAAFHQQIQQLKKQQQLQQQILLQHFQAQQQQLAEQHEQQLRHHLKELWEEQKQIEEQRERREQERLEALRRKDKHEQSAVASSEVKQKLQGFILNKKHREAKAAASCNGQPPNASTSSPAFRNWTVLQSTETAASGSAAPSGGQSPNAASSTSSHPYRVLGDDFPLRKTASEPNLLKVRLKQRVIERRSSPMARRKERPQLKRKAQLAMDSSSSNPESGPNSPPAQPSPTPIQEEGEGSPFNAAGSQQGSIGDLSQLYSSPSMPNISLGRPAGASVHHGHSSHGIHPSETKLAPVSEAEVRAAFTARLGMPLTGQMLGSTLPFYPTLPVIEQAPSTTVSTGPSPFATQQHSIYAPHPPPPHPAITDSQVAHLRLTKQGHRPLGRTQSAPLPLGHPMLQSTGTGTSTGTSLLKQQIRQTVLTRAAASGGAGAATRPPVAHMAAAAAARLEEEDSDQAEVIDLTERRGESEMVRQQRDREQFLQQQRDLMMRHSLAVADSGGGGPGGGPLALNTHHVARPLSRALSSPLVALGSAPPDDRTGSGSPRSMTGLVFDSLMLKHACMCGDNSHHPEHSGRLQSVWARLVETGLVSRCERVRARKATLDELQTCHSEAHALLFGTNPLNRQKLDVTKIAQLPIKSFVRLECGGVGVDSDTTWNDLHTGPAARMAVGCVVDLAMKAATGELRNGFAVVRPPGHHAEASQPMGFCFFNSVAIAAKIVRQRTDVKRVLIVDWDVHHGNGTQQMFYDDPNVLYLSIHRHDDGNFFPGTGGPSECGTGPGLGFTVNVAWSGGLAPPMGDAEYLAAFRCIVMPIAKAFAPDIILVSAGFDAAAGHPPPLGGYQLSPACFGHMTRQLMHLAGGKVILSLEGGYDLASTCDAAHECVRALLGDEPSPLRETEFCRPPCKPALDTLHTVISIQMAHWPCLKRHVHTCHLTALEASQKDMDESETVKAIASLSMQQRCSSSSLHRTPNESREPSEEPMEQDEEESTDSPSSPSTQSQQPLPPTPSNTSSAT